MVEGISEIIKGQSPQERRPVMAMYSKYFTKAEVEELLSDEHLDVHISKYEWTEARRHANHPGPFKAIVKPKTRRSRFNNEVILEFMGHLNGYLQDHAFGDKNAVTTTGAIVQVDAVSTTASTAYIMDEYIKIYHPERLHRIEGGCDKKCPKSGIYCMKEEGHEGQHKFTEDTMLSPSSIEKVVAGLTSGRLKSMQGLDDEDVRKGSGNLERVKEIYSVLAAINQTSPSSIKTMTDRITAILTFHRTGFVTHLQRHGDRCCQCISCGLHCEDEPIHCPIRDDDARCHQGPCKDCDESFKVFSDLFDLIHTTQSLPHVSSDERLREQYHELEEELKQCQVYFIHWRSRIVRKSVESKFSREQVQNLKEDEAIVVSDFKMKILDQRLKETKQQFFGKRGTACLGFMVMTNQEQIEGFVDVRFYLFFSDDTTQDTNFVLAGKHYIYTTIIPSLFPNGTKAKVRFESDGAGSFNSNLAKAALPFWETWSNDKVVECQIRHSVNGDGKSTLDALFGKLRSCLMNAVDNGITDITDARSCLKAYDGGAGIDGTSAFVLELNQKYDLDVGNNKLPILQKSHRLVLDPENNRCVAFRNSGYGNGTPISIDTLKGLFDGSPDAPQYNIISSGPDSAGAAQHSTESYQSRVQRKTALKRDTVNDALVTAGQNVVDKAKENNVFLCDVCDPLTKARCAYQCNSQMSLDAHKQSNKHKFPSRNLKDEAIAIASMEGGKLAYGSRPNRSEVHSNHTVSNGQGRSGELEAHFAVGCYCKPAREKPKPFNAELKRILIEMFEEGESADGDEKRGKNKYTPKQALESLRQMRNDAGLLKFSSTSEFGKLPTESQIKGFWSRYKTTRNKQDEWVDAALECENEVDEDTVGEVAPIATKKRGIAQVRQKKKQSRCQKKGKLVGKRFLVDGEFDEKHGGIDSDGVVALIKQHGGTVNKKISKNVGEALFLPYHIRLHPNLI